MICGLKPMYKEVYMLPGNEIGVNINNIIYHVYITAFTKDAIIKAIAEGIDNSQRFYLTIHEIIGEDKYNLYGFDDNEEYKTFKRLLSVQGIGAGTAIKILSECSHEKLTEIIDNNDLKELKKIKGVGPVAAGRIINGK